MRPNYTPFNHCHHIWHCSNCWKSCKRLVKSETNCLSNYMVASSTPLNLKIKLNLNKSWVGLSWVGWGIEHLPNKQSISVLFNCADVDIKWKWQRDCINEAQSSYSVPYHDVPLPYNHHTVPWHTLTIHSREMSKKSTRWLIHFIKPFINTIVWKGPQSWPVVLE